MKTECDISALWQRISRWFGVTYREDKPQVVAEIGKLVASGEYPAKLF